jgi:hypothetical protein
MEPAAVARPTSAMDEVKEFGLFFMEQGSIGPQAFFDEGMAGLAHNGADAREEGIGKREKGRGNRE